jgi:hypothetical protein
MNNDWSLRTEILAATHRWTVIMAYGLVGILLGLLAAFIWPSHIQATRELYVGLNVYQIEGDQGVSGIANPQFIFVDNYKNWQMANLNSLVFMDAILDETLSRLKSADSYWETVDRKQLAGMLAVYWRNVGSWQLAAEHPDEVHASQAASAWGDVILEGVHNAVDAARESMLLDLQIRAAVEAQALATAQAATYTSHLDTLEGWRTQISVLAADQPLEDTTHTQLWDAAKQINTTAGSVLPLETFPTMGADAAAYLAWLDRGILLLDLQVRGAQAQIAALTEVVDDLAAQYAGASQESMGLSANLIVEDISESAPLTSAERPTGLFVFIGALLGLIAWAITWVAQIALRSKTSGAP